MTWGFQIVKVQPEEAGSMLRVQALTVRAATEGVYNAAKLEEWARFPMLLRCCARLART